MLTNGNEMMLDDHREVDTLPVFCPSELLKRCLGKHEFAQRIVDRFVNALPGDLQALEDAFQTGDADGLTRIAHRFKGAAANMAANRMRHVLEQIEANGRKQQLHTVAEWLPRLESEAGSFVRSVEQWREQSTWGSFTS